MLKYVASTQLFVCSTCTEVGALACMLHTGFVYLLSGAVRLLFGDGAGGVGGGAAFTGRCSRRRGHGGGDGATTGAWISCLDVGVSGSHNNICSPLRIIRGKAAAPGARTAQRLVHHPSSILLLLLQVGTRRWVEKPVMVPFARVKKINK